MELVAVSAAAGGTGPAHPFAVFPLGAPARLASWLFLQGISHTPVLGPSHWLFPLLESFSSLTSFTFHLMSLHVDHSIKSATSPLPSTPHLPSLLPF